MALGVCSEAHHHIRTNQHAHISTGEHRHILTGPTGAVHRGASPRSHNPTCSHRHSYASAHPHMAWGCAQMHITTTSQTNMPTPTQLRIGTSSHGPGVCTVARHHVNTNQHALNRTAAHRHILTWPGECAQLHITTTAQTNMPSTAPPHIGTASHGLRGVHRGTSPRSHKPASPHQHSHASAHPHMAPGRVHSCTSPRPHKPTCSHQHGHASAHPHRASGGCTAAHHHVRTGQHAHINTTTHRRNSTVGVAHRGTSPRTHLST